jgi:hypothetical protein
VAKKHASNPISEKEQAEGERETVDEALEHRQPPGAADTHDHEGQGISNHPASEEARQQQKLPPRGEAKA